MRTYQFLRSVSDHHVIVICRDEEQGYVLVRTSLAAFQPEM
jgi:hypothetical protein